MEFSEITQRSMHLKVSLYQNTQDIVFPKQNAKILKVQLLMGENIKNVISSSD
jgi:hypothetical protein